MGWLIIAVVLVLPFLLLRFDRHVAVRIALLLFWVGCAGQGAWFLVEADKAERDLVAVRTYALPDAPGTHRISITPPSQTTMKAVLKGGRGVLSPDELKKLDWKLPVGFFPPRWFEPMQHDGPGSDETLLFYVMDRASPDGPIILEYRVEPETAELLRGRSLVVGHDGGARHIIRNHLLPFLYLFGWGLIVWGGLWMIVQAVREATRGKKNASGPAGTEAFLSPK